MYIHVFTTASSCFQLRLFAELSCHSSSLLPASFHFPTLCHSTLHCSDPQQLLCLCCMVCVCVGGIMYIPFLFLYLSIYLYTYGWYAINYNFIHVSFVFTTASSCFQLRFGKRFKVIYNTLHKTCDVWQYYAVLYKHVTSATHVYVHKVLAWMLSVSATLYYTVAGCGFHVSTLTPSRVTGLSISPSQLT